MAAKCKCLRCGKVWERPLAQGMPWNDCECGSHYVQWVNFKQCFAHLLRTSEAYAAVYGNQS